MYSNQACGNCSLPDIVAFFSKLVSGLNCSLRCLRWLRVRLSDVLAIPLLATSRRYFTDAGGKFKHGVISTGNSTTSGTFDTQTLKHLPREKRGICVSVEKSTPNGGDTCRY